MGLKRNIDLEGQAAARIVAAAEKLFSAHGVEQTSIRQITNEAGVNIASVNYHFGSKDDLVEAVFEKLIHRVSQERLTTLSAIIMKAEAGGSLPSLSEIVSSFMQPYLGRGNEAQGILMARFMLAFRLTPNDVSRRIAHAYVNPLAKTYVEAFAKACPTQSKESLWWSYMFMVNTIVMIATERSDSDRVSILTDGKLSFADRTSVRDALVKFIIGGVTNTQDMSFQEIPLG